MQTIEEILPHREPFLLIDGVLQNQDNVISVKAGRVRALPSGAEEIPAAPAHNFH